MAKPSASSTAHASAEIIGENSQVKMENTPTPSTSKENTSFPSTSKEDGSSFNEFTDMSDSRTESESSNEQEMLRRRRLQKFSPPPTTE